MLLTIYPASHFKGEIYLPVSKSYSIRAFIIAACGGSSTIINPSNCDDAKVAIRVARSLGAKILHTKTSGTSFWNVVAFGKSPNLSCINVNESGTVLRLLLPLLALQGGDAHVVGEGTLKGRPNVFLTQTLRGMGMDIRGKGKGESVPITVRGGMFKGGHITIDGSLSSQFVSALLIAAPQLPDNTRLRLTGSKLVSSDYITMTRQVLDLAGIQISQKGLREYRVKGLQTFKGLKNFWVPSDYGLAAFFMAGAALVDSDVTLSGYFNDALIQADGHILSLLQRMGVTFRKTSRAIRMRGPFQLKGGDFSLKNCPDLVPIMSILALFAKGKTRLYDIGHARAKESDRISDLRKELVKVGAKISEQRDEFTIYPQENYHHNCLLDPHHDHRLAMSFSILGLKLGVRVKDTECTRKSYPDFFRDFKKLGAKVCKS